MNHPVMMQLRDPAFGSQTVVELFVGIEKPRFLLPTVWPLKREGLKEAQRLQWRSHQRGVSF